VVVSERFLNEKELHMIKPVLATRLMFAAALVLGVAATAALAGGPRPPGPPDGKGPGDPAKREKCQQLARERGFLGGGNVKGGIKPGAFIGDCMRGKQT
jgi:hypothetical protein